MEGRSKYCDKADTLEYQTGKLVVYLRQVKTGRKDGFLGSRNTQYKLVLVELVVSKLSVQSFPGLCITGFSAPVPRPRKHIR